MGSKGVLTMTEDDNKSGKLEDFFIYTLIGLWLLVFKFFKYL
jgi:hypothetical protein